MNIRDYLKEHILLTDGAMGTYFDEKTGGEFLCSEEANLFSPAIIRDIHEEYIEAGAQLIRSNTFSANRKTYREIMERRGDAREAVARRQNLTGQGRGREMDGAAGSDDGFRQFVQAGYRIARETAQEAVRRGKTVFAAADIGPIYEDGESSPADIREEYREIVDAFLERNAEVFVLETFPDERHVLFMAEYIRKKNPDAFIIGQFSFVPTGYGRTGFHYKTVLKKAAGSGLLDAIGLNCGIGAAHMEKFLRTYLTENVLPENTFLSALPNCGYPQIIRGHVVYSDSVEYFGKKAAGLTGLGVRILGGCCGTTPEYICRIAEELARDGEPGNVPDAGQIKAVARRENRPAQSGAEEAGGEERKPVPVKIRPSTDKKEKAGKVPAANTFREKLEKGEPVVAVELDPPFDADMEKLLRGGLDLRGTPADIITLADSPLARSRADSLLTAVKLQQETGMAVMPHLACRDRNRIALRSGLLGAYLNEIRNILIVTGDPVGRDERAFTKSVFDFNSIKLMEFLTSLNEELFPEDPLFYGGALNQNGARPDKIAERMKRKIDAGCQFFLTQPVYSEEEIARLDWMKKETGARILIGIMPLVSHRNALFIKNEMPGIHVPDEVLAQYAPEGTREEWEQTAISICHHVIDMGRDVGAGYYFMTPFHRVKLIRQIMEDSGLSAERKGTAGRMDGRQ